MPEYNGFNRQRSHNSGQSLKTKIKVVFTPLFDCTPSDPLTHLTTMAEAAGITHKAGQSVTVFTADQQLYTVPLNILRTYETRFTNFLPNTDGMHWVMSFVGCKGVRMKNSGLLSWLRRTFCGAGKRLMRKSFPSI